MELKKDTRVLSPKIILIKVLTVLVVIAGVFVWKQMQPGEPLTTQEEQKPFVVEPSSEPLPPPSLFSVELAVADFTEPPKLGSETDITVTVEFSIPGSYVAPPRFSPDTVRIDLSEGITLVSGDTEWEGDLIVEIPVIFNARIRFTEVGDWTLEASVKFSTIHIDRDQVCFSVSRDKITMKSGECPIPPLQVRGKAIPAPPLPPREEVSPKLVPKQASP